MRLRRPLPAVQGDTIHIVGVGDNRIGKEQIFDPPLEFKMTKKDILDEFQANGISRDNVSSDQIEEIYVRVIRTLRVGELRDLTYEEQLHRYVLLKLYEIKITRNDWELNGR